jgi:hypothetical protein
MTPAAETPPVSGSDTVVSWFGYWPGFHDSEIIELRLGAESVLRLRAFEMTDQIDAAGCYKLRKHCIVSFWFADEVEFSVTSDSGSNGIVFGLDFQKTGDRLKMEIQSSCGVDGWITAKTWRVELEPGKAESKERIDQAAG